MVNCYGLLDSDKFQLQNDQTFQYRTRTWLWGDFVAVKDQIDGPQSDFSNYWPYGCQRSPYGVLSVDVMGGRVNLHLVFAVMYKHASMLDSPACQCNALRSAKPLVLGRNMSRYKALYPLNTRVHLFLTPIGFSSSD